MGDRLGIPRVVGFPVLPLAVRRRYTTEVREVTELSYFALQYFFFFQTIAKWACKKARRHLSQVVSPIKSTFSSPSELRVLSNSTNVWHLWHQKMTNLEPTQSGTRQNHQLHLLAHCKSSKGCNDWPTRECPWQWQTHDKQCPNLT